MFSVLVTAGFANFFLNLSIYKSLLIGCILGGSSSIIVLPIVQALKVDKKVQTLLSLESTLTDIFVVVMTLIIIEFIISNSGINFISTFQIIASRFSVGIILGLVIGLFWLLIFPSIRKDPYRYTATLFVAFLVYAISEFLGGSGALSTLIFGIILGNGSSISEILKLKREITLGSDVLIFHSEISFLIRSFFFVYIGIISSIRDPILIIFGVIISVLLLNVRLVASYASSVRSSLKKYRLLMAVMLPRGLATAALCTLPVGLGIAGTEFFPDIGFVVILTTTLISVAGTVVLKRNREIPPSPSSEYLEEEGIEELTSDYDDSGKL
jgi:cell volume regulation protein A